MNRQTGHYRISSTLGEETCAFVPYPLPPADPPLVIDGQGLDILRETTGKQRGRLYVYNEYLQILTGDDA